jgi:hypothetical protein
VVVDTVNNELVVANTDGHSVTVYSRTASGNTAPLRNLSGPATGLSFPGVAVDTVNNELLVGNGGNNSITVYSRTASGNTAPLRTLSGPATGLSVPSGSGPALDLVNNELLVQNLVGNSITVYSRTASGNAAPLRTISGPATGLNDPIGLAVDPVHNELVASSFIGSTVGVFSRTGSGNVAPLRVLSGDMTGISGPEGLAVTPAALPTPSPTAFVGLNAADFSTGQTINYQAVTLPGSAPVQVDIYLGCLLPDFATFLSLVQPVAGTINVVLGPAPVPFLANVPLAPLGVPFPYTFGGFEPAGTYFPYAGLAVAGSDPFVPANQLSLSVQSFLFTP